MSAPSPILIQESSGKQQLPPLAMKTSSSPQKHWAFALNSLLSFNESTTEDKVVTEDWSAKEDEIMACLAGDEQQAVNLWKLRELALTPGGLVSPECRKRAWPKLVACHEQMLAPSSLETNTSHMRPLTRSQAQALQTDLRSTIWDVEGELRRRKEARKQEQAEIDALLEEERLRNKRVKFAPVMESLLGADGEAPPAPMRASPTNSEDDREFISSTEDEDSSSQTRFSFNEPSSNSSVGTISPCTVHSQETNLVSILSNSSNSSTRAIRGRKATLHERNVLYTLITKLLRMDPPNSDKNKIQYYTYHPGFQDLVSILLYNLESPTVTSFILPQLATHHWRPLLSSKSHLEDFLSATFMPLLEQVDHRLALHLHEQGMKLPTFARSWCATWFASDVAEAAAASRLIDVLLVSHPFMVVYMSVAWVTQQRNHILRTSDFVVLAKTLRRLPFEKTQEAKDLSHVEDVIARAISYMQKVPPPSLVTLVQNLAPGSSAEQTLDSSSPAWLTSDVAPSDWALLAKKIPKRKVLADPKDYPLAAVVTGHSLKQSSLPHTKRHTLLILFGLVLSALGLAVTMHYAWPIAQVSPVQQYLPSTKRRRQGISRKPLPALTFAYYNLMRTENLGDGLDKEDDSDVPTPSILSKALIVFVGEPKGEENTGAGKPLRAPWWKRFTHFFQKWFVLPSWWIF